MTTKKDEDEVAHLFADVSTSLLLDSPQAALRSTLLLGQLLGEIDDPTLTVAAMKTFDKLLEEAFDE